MEYLAEIYMSIVLDSPKASEKALKQSVTMQAATTGKVHGRNGLIPPLNGNGTFEDIMALVETFTAIQAEDDLFDTIGAERLDCVLWTFTRR